MENINSDFKVKSQYLDPKEQEKINDYYHDQYIVKYTMMKYGDKGYFFPEKIIPFFAQTRTMRLRPSDIFVASFPKSGTTWTQELVWLVNNDLDFEKATSVRLTNRYMFLESPTFFPETQLKSVKKNENWLKAIEIIFPYVGNIDLIPSPRLFKTHLPMSFLPYDILERAKVVYVARDPRDVAVSYYYHTRLMKMCAENKTLKEFWELFIKNHVPWAPIWEHIKEAWRLRDHPNMLFLFYEELSKDLPAAVQRVASFFSKKLSNDEIVRLCEYLKFENFKDNAAVNLEEVKKFDFLNENEYFIRKGVVGEWKEHFDVEMKQQAERWMSDNMRDSNLRFPQ